ncbi:MAG: family 20 glycosylhydrolase [Bacteroidota bacterium]
MKFLLNIWTVWLLVFSLAACDTTTELHQSEDGPISTVFPEPNIMEGTSGDLWLTKESRLYSPEESVQPLLQLFASELAAITGVFVDISPANSSAADIKFDLDPSLAEEAFVIDIAQTVEVWGGSYGALVSAKGTLLQLAMKHTGGHLAFPQLHLEDQPDVAYRGLLVDLARKWHTVEEIKPLIDLASFYKINYLQLHFTDHQSYTLPSEAFPNLRTPGRHYSVEELKELEAYSQLRGVTIVPELEVPGHSEQFVRAYPEIFAIEDTANNPWIIHMGREEVYEALDALIGEMVEVFQATPYFHIGGDEAYFASVMDDAEVQAYMAAKGLEPDVHELYRHFLVRMNEIVKRHGKQMCVWEGFTPEGKVAIPKDILVFEFETNRYLPGQLLEDGYTVVNTSWKPLYVVNQKKWAPETIYGWNLWRWENWFDQAPSIIPIQVEKNPLVVGAQMCSWEQPAEVELPSLRQRLPYFVERIWNTEQQLPFDAARARVEETDRLLSKLLQDDRQDSLLHGYNFSKEMLE